MPRRKKTKKNATSRVRPMLPEGDLETSMSIDERRAKLDVYIEDFNMQVEERIEKMKARGHEMICKVKGAFAVEILKLPMHLRKMKLSDFFAQGGQVNDNALTEASDFVSEMTRSIILNPSTALTGRAPMTDVGNLPVKTPVPGSKRKKGGQSSTVKFTEGQIDETASSVRSLRSRKRKDASPRTVDKGTRSSKSRKTKENDVSQTIPPSTGKRMSKRIQSKAQFVTPAGRGVLYSCTPMVTPKFDPHLPLTPALLREPKAGERIMSLSGSPIVNHGPVSSDAEVLIPLGNGQTFHLNTASHLSPSQPAVLDDTARKNVELLQEKLAQLLVLPSSQNK